MKPNVFILAVLLVRIPLEGAGTDPGLHPIFARAEVTLSVAGDPSTKERAAFQSKRLVTFEGGITRWVIKSEPADVQMLDTATPILFSEFWCDGELIFQVSYWKNAHPPEKTSLQGAPRHASHRVAIHKGSVPAFDTELCFPVWLAFASAGYLEKEPQPMPQIVRMGMFVPNSSLRLTRAAFVLREVMGGVYPESIDFYNVGKYPVEMVDVHRPAARLLEFEGPLSSGFLEARFQVTGWFEESGVGSPRLCSLGLYPPDVAGGRTNLHAAGIAPAALVSIETLKIGRSEERDWSQPDLPANTAIVVDDYRTIIGGEPLRYVTTNGILQLGDGDYSRVVAERTAILNEDNRRQDPWKATRPMLVGLVFIATTGGFVWLWKRRNQR